MDIIKKNVPLVAFCLYTGKLLIMGAGLADAYILVVLASIWGFFEYKVSEKQLVKLNERVDSQSKDIENLKMIAAQLKLGAGMKSLGNGR